MRPLGLSWLTYRVLATFIAASTHFFVADRHAPTSDSPADRYAMGPGASKATGRSRSTSG